MKFLYKYPQAEFPYAGSSRRTAAADGQRLRVRAARHRHLRRGPLLRHRHRVRQGRRRKTSAIRIEAFNRGPEPAPLHILPHLWFRNTWAWAPTPEPEPSIRLGAARRGRAARSSPTTRAADAAQQSSRSTTASGHARSTPRAAARRCSPTTRPTAPRVFGPRQHSRSPFVKDAFHRHVIDGEDCVNPAQVGTKAALHYRFDASRRAARSSLRLRLSDQRGLAKPLADVDADRRPAPQAEADEFYAAHPPGEGDRRRAPHPAPGARRPALDASRATSSTCTSGSTATTPTLPPPPTAHADPQRALAAPQLDARA